MESRNENPVRPVGEKTWLVIAGRNNKYIVCTEQHENKVLAALRAGDSIECVSVFDYVSPIVPTPMGGMSKQQVVSRLDATLLPTKAHISLQGALVYFLSDLSESDKKEYQKLMRDALDMAERAKKHRDQGPSSLVMPTR